MNKFPMLLIAMALIANGGCGPIALKQGSGAADLNRDETECRAQQPTDDGTAKCLRDKGWTITQFSSPVGAIAPAPAATANTATTTEQPNATIETAAAPAAIDPQKKLLVQSWWKAGAQAVDFNNDANACVAILGSEHAPNYAERTYSNGLVQCLRDKGWHAGANPIYTAPR